MNFRNFATPHCHSSSSLDTASRPEAFARWEAEHETGFMTVTDHGTLAGVRKVYDLCNKKYKGKVSCIPGLEAYFRDDACPILTAAGIPRDEEMKFAGYQKYFHLTMHFLDQRAYEAAVRLLSRADAAAEKHGKERKPIFSWADLEELGGENITFASSCLIGMVQRHLAFGRRDDIARAYYERLRALAKPGNFYVEAFPHVCDRDWDAAVILRFEDGSEESFPTWKNLKTDRVYSQNKQGKDRAGIKAQYLAEAWARDRRGHGRLRGVMENRAWVDREDPKPIVDVRLVEGFQMNECVPGFCPDGDLQAPCNRFVIEMAKRHGDPILISDDSHFTVPEEKIVQDIKLQQSGPWRFHTSYHRMTSAEAWGYFDKVLGIGQAEFESWIDNNVAWADRFRGLKFAPRTPPLPVRFYPTNTLEHTMVLIQRHGRMAWNDPVRLERLRQEIDLLHYNGTIDLLPYFMIDEEVCSLYEAYGELTGPGRGSAAGLSLAYLLDITHADPLRYGLSKDRFLTPDRIKQGKLPDIDQDLPHRDLLVSAGSDDEDEDEGDEEGEAADRGWLRSRFGDCVAQISTDVTMKLRASVLDVARIMSPDRQIPRDITRLTKMFLQAPQGVLDRDFVFGYKDGDSFVQGSITYDEALIQYTKTYPEQWAIVQKCLGITRTKSRHACAFLIANEPIQNFIPLTSVNGVRVTQPTAEQVESSGGLKMDFLIINSLKDIGLAIKLIQARSEDRTLDWQAPERFRRRMIEDPAFREAFSAGGERPPATVVGGKRVPLIRIIPHRGKHLDVWDLPEDQAVFHDICEGNTESVFQFSTPGAVKWLRHFNHVRSKDPDGTVHKALDSIETLAAFTALDRPGPLDAYVRGADGEQHNMLVEFARRARGEPAIGSFPILDRLFPETYGILVYQEQVQRAFHEIGGTTAIQANDFRIHVSKKQPMEIIKDRDIFMPGAIGRIGKEAAEQLFQSMETFGAYGFNKSHAVCYVIIAYACAWLKHHYPLEWWTAVLRHAKKKEIDEKFWRHCGHLIDMPDVVLSGPGFEIVEERIRAPLSLLHGVGEKAHEELCSYRPIASLDDLCRKIQAKKENESKVVEKRDGSGAVTKRVQKGRSSLNSKVINTLVVTGAMDSLFEPGMDTVEKLQRFIDVNAKVTGNVYKKTGAPKEKVPPQFISLNRYSRYQLKKKLLPPYSENLFLAMAEGGLPGLHVIDTPTPQGPRKQWVYKHQISSSAFELYSPVTAAGLQHFADLALPRGQTLRLAAAAFVLSYERRTFHEKKEMASVVLDVEGMRLPVVRWPDRNSGRLPGMYHEDLSGSIVLALLSKWNAAKPYTIDDLVIVQPRLDDDDAKIRAEEE